VTVEDNAFLGPNVVFTNDLMPRSKQYPEQFLKTLVEEGASIGANSVVVAGTTIGKYAMVGAGSVVTKDVPPYSLAYGNPARVKGFICECTEKLQFNSDTADCKCGKKYIKSTAGEVSRIS